MRRLLLKKSIALYINVYLFVYTMDINKIKRRNGDKKKTVLITIRITPKMSKWLKEKDYSPTGLFYEAVKELGYKEEQ